MIELLETGMDGKIGVYVTVDELDVKARLRRLKAPTAVYFDTKQGSRLIAEHWLLHPITAKKMFKGLATVKLADE